MASTRRASSQPPPQRTGDIKLYLPNSDVIVRVEKPPVSSSNGGGFFSGGSSLTRGRRHSFAEWCKTKFSGSKPPISRRGSMLLLRRPSQGKYGVTAAANNNNNNNAEVRKSLSFSGLSSNIPTIREQDENTKNIEKSATKKFGIGKSRNSSSKTKPHNGEVKGQLKNPNINRPLPPISDGSRVVSVLPSTLSRRSLSVPHSPSAFHHHRRSICVPPSAENNVSYGASNGWGRDTPTISSNGSAILPVPQRGDLLPVFPRYGSLRMPRTTPIHDTPKRYGEYCVWASRHYLCQKLY